MGWRVCARLGAAVVMFALVAAAASSRIGPPGQAGAAVPGLVAAYGFSETAGSIATDASGNGNTGTLNNATHAAGKSGNGLAFDGASAVVRVADSASLDLTSAVTMEAWLNLTSNTGWRTVLMKEAPGALSYGLYANTDTNQPSFEASTSVGPFDIRANTQLPLNTWTHVATTFDGVNARLFINGVQITSIPASGTITTSNNQLSIGANAIWGEYFNGVIDEVRIYNRALTAAEITTDMNTPVDSGGPPPTPTFTATATAAANASQVGQWSAVTDWPKFAVHLALERTGEVAFWDTIGPSTDAQIWNPATGVFTSVPTASNIFCAGQSSLSDGRLIVLGGHGGEAAEVGTKETNIFDPVTRTWTRMPDMNSARWYPSSTTLPDGRVVAISGSITSGVWADTPEVYDPATNVWTALSGVNTSDMHDGGYPLAHVLPNGKVFVLGAAPGTLRTLDVNAQTWTNSGSLPFTFGSAVMYRPGKFLYSGGGPAWDGPSGKQAVVIDATGASVTQRAVASMAYPRWQHNLVMLPDGRVLAVGGSTVINTPSTTGSLPAEIFNPTTETWTTMAAQQVPRMYHSTAVLLPDGRILSTGGGSADVIDSPTAEIYSPPYLFGGARPVIANAPSFIDYSTPITITTNDAASIATVSLIPLAAQTHTLDAGQTYLSLNFTAGVNQLTATPPANAALATPGFYMLFIVNGNGVPGVAKIVQVGGSAPSGTATPTNTATATSTGTATRTPTATATRTPTATATATATGTPTATATGTPTPTAAVATATHTPTPTQAVATSTPTPTATATNTPAPPGTSTPTPTNTATSPPTATPAPCPIRRADLDGDGAVSILDLTMLAAFFTRSVPPAPPGYDQDGDGVISVLDLTRISLVFGHYVSECPP